MLTDQSVTCPVSNQRWALPQTPSSRPRTKSSGASHTPLTTKTEINTTPKNRQSTGLPAVTRQTNTSKTMMIDNQPPLEPLSKEAHTPMAAAHDK